MKTIAIAGANGFIGSQLIPYLSNNFFIKALSRKKKTSDHPHVTWHETELFSLSSTTEALKDVDIAIYLVHSMLPSSRLFQGSFQDTDLLLADNFARACKTNKIQHIVYLGGIVPEKHISTHLQSRKEVEDVLTSSGIPTTVLRAGMVVGPGGSSFEILRTLVKQLPFMVLPRWTQTTTQTVFIDDVLRVVSACLTNNTLQGRTLNVVNGEQLTYEDILRRTADGLKLTRSMFSVPVHSTGFSKLWVQIFGNASYELVSPLIDSLLSPLPHLQPHHDIAHLIQYKTFSHMLQETTQRDTPQTQKNRTPKAHTHTNNVRSIQRLTAVTHNCLWVSQEYIRWLPTFFHKLLYVKHLKKPEMLGFYCVFSKKPLLVLEHIHNPDIQDRQKFHIVGGILTKTAHTGWLEFRQIQNQTYLLACIHEFVPKLPWFIYILTQAPMHQYVMNAFSKHLKKQ